MPLSLRTNVAAMNTARHLKNSYLHLSASVQRLSSGLRLNAATDDAAGLGIRELMRTDIAAFNQGVRNANDAISMIQVADGALQVIDEKLIRMKELAEQAATGTYNSDQRLLINNEFQAMASEIERIARSTNFNGIKLLDGSLSGAHDGSGLASTGKLKIHFGTGNQSAEDYYYINIGNATLEGLGLRSDTAVASGGNGGGGGTHIGTVPILSERVNNNTFYGGRNFWSGIISFAIIPAGTKNLRVKLNDAFDNDTIELFTRNGVQLAGTPIGWHADINTFPEWKRNGVVDNSTMESMVLTEENAFLPGATYDATLINGTGGVPAWTDTFPYNTFSYNGMQIGYSGEGNAYQIPVHDRHHIEYLCIDEVTEDLVMLAVGTGVFTLGASWDEMPLLVNGNPGTEGATEGATGVTTISISTQQLAQEALPRLDDAIIKKDKIRAHLGASQNRLENTIANLSIQAENLQASESRISDVDAATEMTEFVRSQLLTRSATAMLAQTNSLPRMLLSLLNAPG